MKKSIRLAVLTAMGALALAAAGSAFAVYTPTLAISPGNLTAGGAGANTIKFTSSAADDATAKLTIYAPLGYTVNLSQAVGATIGKVNAQIIAVALGGALLPLTGDIVVDDPAKYTSAPASVGCAGAAAHNAVWLLNLSVAGQTLAVPVYVDKTAGAEATFASMKLQTCLSSPNATVAQGGNSVGAKAVSVDFTFNGVLTNPATAGDNTWRALFTPYVTGGIAVNAAGTIESRSIVRLPAALTFAASRGKVSGKVSEGGKGLAGLRVQIWGGRSANKLAKLGTVRAKSNGSFSYKTKKGTIYQAKVTLGTRGNTTAGCAGGSFPAFAPVPCATATIGGWTAASKAVKGK